MAEPYYQDPYARHPPKPERVSGYTESGPGGAGNTCRSLTRSLALTKEGLMPDLTLPGLNMCECGCDSPVAKGRRFVSGHNLRVMERTEGHRQAISDSLKHAWATKRKRMPIGARRRDSRGYWLVKTREGGGRWDKEHVLIAEAVAGRKLEPDECVHHINCIRDDNRPENLAILTHSEHAKAHSSLNALVAGLIADGLIGFDSCSGRYLRA